MGVLRGPSLIGNARRLRHVPSAMAWNGIMERARRSVRFRPEQGRLQEHTMSLLKWALIMLIVSLVAAVFGFAGLAAASADVARVLFFIFVVIFLVLLVLGLFGARAARGP